MGVPVVTVTGDRHAGRVGTSIMHHTGLSESLVANDMDSYIDLAVSLSGDRQRLAELRKTLREQMKNSQLCNAGLFAKNVEEAFLNMWLEFNKINDERISRHLKL